TVIGSVVDDRREEVEREDQRAFVVEPVDRCIVGRRESDEQIFCVGGNETREQLLEPRGRVLRSTSSTRGEVGQFHSAGLGVQAPSRQVELGNVGLNGPSVHSLWKVAVVTQGK